MRIKKALRSELKKSELLTSIEIKEMWYVYSHHHNVNYKQFLNRTCQQFHYIILCRDVQTRKIIGFLGVRFDEIHFEDGKAINLIYYGQTFIKPEFRGANSLKLCLCLIGLKYRFFHPFKKTYIWFDAISYKSYLLMSRYTKDFYPAPHRKMPTQIKNLRNIIGHKFYPGQYNADYGTVTKSSHRIKDLDSRVQQKDLDNEHIRFYTTKNPGHIQGDGLICIFPNTLANYAFTIKRLFRKKIWYTIRVAFNNIIELFNQKKRFRDNLRRTNS